MPPEVDQETRFLADQPVLRVRALTLEVTAGPDAGTRARVDRPVFVIGTGASADLRLTDDTVSREHVRFSLTQAGVHVRDDGSTNGTWIGGLRVNDALLTTPTAVTLGSTVISLQIDAETFDLPLAASERFGEAVGGSATMRHVFAVLARAAASEVTVLVEGESGTGKELLAHAIHVHSERKSGPFVAIDCGALPPNLIESELFGHERGAFTGADRARLGAFEQANGGTLFLDEIGELPLDLQPKLLRALETRQVRPLGASGARNVDVRIVAATNRNLADAAQRPVHSPSLSTNFWPCNSMRATGSSGSTSTVNGSVAGGAYFRKVLLGPSRLVVTRLFLASTCTISPPSTAPTAAVASSV